MKCRDCKVDVPEYSMTQGKCSACYYDPERFPLTGVLIYIFILLFLLVLIWL